MQGENKGIENAKMGNSSLRVGVQWHEWQWRKKTCQRYCRDRIRQVIELEEEISN